MGEIGIEEIPYKISKSERHKKVDARAKENEPRGLYHATTKRFRVGDIVVPGENFTSVSLADNPIPHVSIVNRIIPEKWWRDAQVENGKWREEWDGKWYIYEVKPIGPVEYSPEEEEILAKEAKIIRFVGEARSMLEREQLKLKSQIEKGKSVRIGSSVQDGPNKLKGIIQVKGRGKHFWEINQVKLGLKEKREKG